MLDNCQFVNGNSLGILFLTECLFLLSNSVFARFSFLKLLFSMNHVVMGALVREWASPEVSGSDLAGAGISDINKIFGS